MNTKWIGIPDAEHCNWKAKVVPAPFFRRVVELTPGKSAEVEICGLGYYELYLNGAKVGDRELDPAVSVYDRRVRFVRYDVTKLLKPGKNVFGVILGNGWYNCASPEAWHFDKAVWRDQEKFRFELKIDGMISLVSDESWQLLTDGPIRYDELREGEIYDARKEPGNWLAPNFDASKWIPAARVHSPGGLLEEMTSEPCKVLETLPMTLINDKFGVWRAIENMAGRARITVKGEAGAKVTLKYGEILTPEGDLSQDRIAQHVYVKDFQTEVYTLKGGSTEVWESRFTYHGFEYCKVIVEGSAKVLKLESQRIGTAFPRAGKFTSEDADVAKLMRMTETSYISNFVGIPTDCPHREKNGWTGDAQLACETGLFLYDAGAAYTTWLDTLADGQRPSGQLSGIAPCSGWGYNWGGGPAWDAALFVIPDAIYRYSGSTAAIKKFYPNMCRYIDYALDMADDFIVHFGLGDWCAPDMDKIASSILTDTGYFALFAKLLAKFAWLLGEKEDAELYSKLHEDIVTAFRKRFRNDAANWGEGTMTEMAAAVYFGMTTPEETRAVCTELVKRLEGDNCRMQFGILGAKYIPRVLADNGYLNTAYKIFTQETYPGYVDWIRRGATSLWESYKGLSSRNHIMYGDLYAWFMTYPGGFHFTENAGLVIQPVIPDGMKPFTAQWHGAETRWDGTTLSVTVPAGMTAEVTLPCRKTETVSGTTCSSTLK